MLKNGIGVFQAKTREEKTISGRGKSKYDCTKAWS